MHHDKLSICTRLFMSAMLWYELYRICIIHKVTQSERHKLYIHHNKLNRCSLTCMYKSDNNMNDLWYLGVDQYAMWQNQVDMKILMNRHGCSIYNLRSMKAMMSYECYTNAHSTEELNHIDLHFICISVSSVDSAYYRYISQTTLWMV